MGVMTNRSFNYVIKVINSCETYEQYSTTFDWVDNLRKVHYFSGSQKHQLNETRLLVAGRFE